MLETQIEINTKPKSSTDFLIIREDSLIHNIFEIIVTFLCFVSGLFYANMAAFRIDMEGDQQYKYGDAKYYYITGRDDEKISFLKQRILIIEAVFLLDFFLSFFIEYSVQEKPDPVRDLSKTALRYFKNEMKFDLLPLIPFQLLATSGIK